MPDRSRARQGCPEPLTKAEALRARFLDDIERLAPEQWLAIGRRFEGEGAVLAANRARVSRLVASYVRAKLASDERFERHTIAFNKWAHARLVSVLNQLPVSVEAAGRSLPLRATATTAARTAEALLRLFEDELEERGGPALASPALRPFAGFVALPAWPEAAAGPRGRVREKGVPRRRGGPTAVEAAQPEAYHVCFPAGYFTYDEPPPAGAALVPLAVYRRDTHHETWRLPGPGLNGRLGGTAKGACGLCKNRLHHLVSLPALPLPALGGSAAGPLSFATCLACVGSAEPVLFFEHARGAAPRPVVSVGPPGRPGPPEAAIRPVGVRLCPTPSRWRRQRWEDSDGQNLNRVGGRPSWIQDPDVPACPRCARRMRFLIQLDSELPTVDGRRWRWGSGGLLYVFWCAACRVDAQLWQCT